MKLHVIAIGSSGNCYLFESQDQYLIIEAGSRFSEVNKKIKGKISKIQALLITHEHGDHAGYANQFHEKGIHINCSAGTISALENYDFYSIEAMNKYRFGVFSIWPINVSHNAVEPLAFVIHTEESGFTLFATDLNEEIDFDNDLFDHLLIEANYCENELMRHEFDNENNFGTKNHLSVQQASSMANSCKDLKNIILLHRSERMSSSNEDMISNFNEKGIVSIAKSGDEFNLKKDPF